MHVEAQSESDEMIILVLHQDGIVISHAYKVCMCGCMYVCMYVNAPSSPFVIRIVEEAGGYRVWRQAIKASSRQSV